MSLNSTSNKKQNGGRHRIYTNEQRKDRNRQAQAAFRARRSLYTKTQKETIAELHHSVHILKESSLQANERASLAEKRCLLLENENQQLKTTMECLLAQSSPRCDSSLTSQSSTSSPATDFSPLSQQPLPLTWSLDPTTFLLDECNKDHLESKFDPSHINILDVPLANDSNISYNAQQPLMNNEFYLGKFKKIKQMKSK